MSKIIAFFLLISTVLLSVGCGSQNSGNNETGSEKVPGVISIDKSEINGELTLGKAVDIFGKPRPEETSSDDPIVLSWSISDSEILYVIFEIDNRKEFMDKLHEGAYILPDETVQSLDHGLRLYTDNELKVLKEWRRAHKAVCAYIVQGREKSVLFDLR